MSSSRRSRRLVLALATTALVAAPGTAAAMPAGPDAPASDTPLTAPVTTSAARVAASPPPPDDGLDLGLVLAAGAFAAAAAGGGAYARHHARPI